MTTEARYESRAATAEDRYERLLTMVEAYEAVTGEVLTEERWPLFLRNRVAA